jgi:hypothetical protein
MSDLGKTTPTPWTIKDGWPRYIYGADGRCIAETDRGKPDVCDMNAALIVLAVNANDYLVDALRAISSHWANQYDHPNMQNPIYQGPYGVGVTDGHRLCKAIADKALAILDDKEGT